MNIYNRNFSTHEQNYIFSTKPLTPSSELFLSDIGETILHSEYTIV